MKTVVRPLPSTLSRDVATERRGAAVVSQPRRRPERDMGIGYGKSSGYGSSDRRYAPNWRQAGFRCA